MKITEVYKQNKNVLSFEIFPPKHQEELDNIDATLEILSELKPDYISVTFGAGGSSNNNKTIELAKKIKEVYKIEPVVHLTCLCYDEKEIDSFAKELKDAGMENILALRGDINPDHPPKNVFMHASDLIAYLKDRYDFCVLGACYPEIHPDSENLISDVRNLKKKVEAGADVLLSQLFFDNNNFYKYVEACRIAGIDTPITPGIMPAINAKSITRMVNMCGAVLPEKYKMIIDKFGDNKEAMYEAGMAYAVSQIIDLLAHGVDGVHLYTMNNPKVARRICDGICKLI